MICGGSWCVWLQDFVEVYGGGGLWIQNEEHNHWGGGGVKSRLKKGGKLSKLGGVCSKSLQIV